MTKPSIVQRTSIAALLFSAGASLSACSSADSASGGSGGSGATGGGPAPGVPCGTVICAPGQWCSDSYDASGHGHVATCVPGGTSGCVNKFGGADCYECAGAMDCQAGQLCTTNGHGTNCALAINIGLVCSATAECGGGGLACLPFEPNSSFDAPWTVPPIKHCQKSAGPLAGQARCCHRSRWGPFSPNSPGTTYQRADEQDCVDPPRDPLSATARFAAFGTPRRPGAGGSSVETRR